MLDRYAYVRNNPLRYTDPSGLCFRSPVTGEMLHCSQQEAFEWTVCASSPENCEAVARNRGIDTSKYDWSEVPRLASCGVGSLEFKDSYAKHLSGASPQELEHYANPHGDYGYLLGEYYRMLKEYGYISDQGDTGNLDDIASWLGDKGGDLLGAIREQPGCSYALAITVATCKAKPGYCEAAKLGFIAACGRDLAGDLVPLPPGKVRA